MKKIYRVGSRPSPLALKQVDEVYGKLNVFFPEAAFTVIPIATYGDGDKKTPIASVEGTDFFTRELDEALLRGDVDFAVHSAKDVPDTLPAGLIIAAMTASIDPYDVLVSKSGVTLDELPRGARIGTSSRRRKDALMRRRDDIEIINIRGTIGERLEALAGENLDGIVIAAAGLVRLGLAERITQRIPFSILTPHPLQGRLAIVARSDARDIIQLLGVLDVREEAGDVR